MWFYFFYLFCLPTAKLKIMWEEQICQRIPEFIYLCSSISNCHFGEVVESSLNVQNKFWRGWLFGYLFFFLVMVSFQLPSRIRYFKFHGVTGSGGWTVGCGVPTNDIDVELWCLPGCCIIVELDVTEYAMELFWLW